MNTSVGHQNRINSIHYFNTIHILVNLVTADFFRNNSNRYKLYRINCCHFVTKRYHKCSNILPLFKWNYTKLKDLKIKYWYWWYSDTLINYSQNSFISTLYTNFHLIIQWFVKSDRFRRFFKRKSSLKCLFKQYLFDVHSVRTRNLF